jgi:flagellar M-ring protein FliF
VNSLSDFWERLSGPARAGLVIGVVAIGVAMGAAAWWLGRTDYATLFSGLSSRDSAAMVEELEKAKVPYQLNEDGSAILVPSDLVPGTRLKLVSKDIPLQGGVGFELFNNSDVGVTDFAQKVNYLRALQGELTRTIVSIDGVQSARVHLVLPEHGLFRKPGSQAKASVTVAMKPGSRLEAGQIRGVQRLVAAAVPEVRAEDVTVLDQRGLALSAPAGEAGEAPAQEAVADGKRQLEDYLARKVSEVLDQAFGAHQSIVRVDAVLNLDQMKVTTESVLPSNVPGAAAAGVIVQEHESGPGAGGAGDATSGGASRNREVKYQVGRRVEQVVTRPGAISKLNVAVIVRGHLDNQQLERVRDLVADAVGLNKVRGDVMAVYSMDQVAGPAPDKVPPSVAWPTAPAGEPAPPDTKGVGTTAVALTPMPWPVLVLAVIAVLALGWSAWLKRRRQVRVAPRLLSQDERQQMLGKVRDWIETARIAAVPTEQVR